MNSHSYSIPGYRQIGSRILLTDTGCAPCHPDQLEGAEQEALLDRVSSSWNLVEECKPHVSRPVSSTTPTRTEEWAGLKRWFLSHHLFITQLSLLVGCLTTAASLASEDAQLAAHWANLAARLRRGCGALFLYGISVEPVSEIYVGTIRKEMPPAFSGFWIRERHSFQPALNHFLRSFSEDAEDKVLACAWQAWDIADQRYHELHERSMYLAVPNGNSLADEYRKAHNNKPHKILDGEFEQYDRWFAIDRSPTVSRLEYVHQYLDLVERAVADLTTGHRLEAPVLSDLLDGFRAAMVVFGHWAGPVSETSKFYPRELRGE